MRFKATSAKNFSRILSHSFGESGEFLASTHILLSPAKRESEPFVEAAATLRSATSRNGYMDAHAVKVETSHGDVSTGRAAPWKKPRLGLALQVIGKARDERSWRHPCRTKGEQTNFGRHAASVDDKDIKNCVGLHPYNSP